ncbi:MAG TPA: arginyltransferase [Stellaceae bacterium]|jgi:arginyl-tRNA--protein-N-Asp/Glu arginylyltransferase|nr:arginyltransferase [Stellaceae bacterium]
MEIGTRNGRPIAEPSWPEPRSLRTTAGLQPLRQFFTAGPVACPYVAGRAERKLIVELTGAAAADFYDELSRVGFRRSQGFAYRPACPQCTACVPVRIAVNDFAHSRSTRRVRNANRGLSGRLVAARATPEHFQLFVAYQRSRHRDSDMAAMTYADYRSMVEDTPLRTVIAEFRDAAGTLVAASLIDRLDDGVSAVYSFYDPALEKRSLGTWSILWLVDECRRQGLPYVYLGYWIGESPKMAYKARFPAIERLSASGWVPVSAAS